MDHYVASCNHRSVVVTGGNRQQALRIAQEYFDDLQGDRSAPIPLGANGVTSIVKLDMPETCRVIYAVPQ